MAKMRNKFVALCYAAIGIIYGSGYGLSMLNGHASATEMAQTKEAADGGSLASELAYPSEQAQPSAGSPTEDGEDMPAGEKEEATDDSTIDSTGLSQVPDQSSAAASAAAGAEQSPTEGMLKQAQDQPQPQPQTQTQPSKQGKTQSKTPTQSQTSKQTKSQVQIQVQTQNQTQVQSQVQSESEAQAPTQDRVQADNQGTNPAADVPPQKYKDGTYSGAGMNRFGIVEVAVTIKSGKIVDVEITNCRTRFPERYIDGLPDEVLAKQSEDVATVSGATRSSEDFIMAVHDALQRAMAS